MSVTNDERIMSLRGQLEEKRKELGEYKRYSPITNCILELEGTRYNLHIASDNYLLVRLHMYVMAANDLGIDPEKVIICGYPVTDWISDIKGFIAKDEHLNKKKQFDALEKQLTELLSDDKQTELRIDALAALLK